MTPDAKGAAEQFEATVVDFGGYKRGNEVRKVGVYDLLYTDPKVSKNASTSTLSTGSTIFRWIHLPANNVTWCQDLLTRRFIEEGMHDSSGFKSLHRSFLHQHGGKRWHSNYMRPGCSATPRKTKTPAGDAPRLSVQAMPPSPQSSEFSDDRESKFEGQRRQGNSIPAATEPARQRTFVRSNTATSAQLGALQVPELPTERAVELDDNLSRPTLRSNARPEATARRDSFHTRRPTRRASFDERTRKNQQDSAQRVFVRDVAASSEHNVYMFAPV